jgi:hypothetical protein
MVTGKQAWSAPPARGLEELWLSVLPLDWSSLAVVPVGAGISASAAAASVSTVASFFEVANLQVLDAEGMSLADGARLQREVKRLVEGGARVVVSVDSPLDHPGAVPVVTGVDAAVLLARVGVSSLVEADRLIAMIGRERVIGCVTIGA